MELWSWRKAGKDLIIEMGFVICVELEDFGHLFILILDKVMWVTYILHKAKSFDPSHGTLL